MTIATAGFHKNLIHTVEVRNIVSLFKCKYEEYKLKTGYMFKTNIGSDSN